MSLLCFACFAAEPRRFLEIVTQKHAQKTGRSPRARRRTAIFYQCSSRIADTASPTQGLVCVRDRLLKYSLKRATVMQSSICLEDVDEGAPNCRTVSTERDGQPPVSEPPPVKAHVKPPPSGPLKPEAFLARQRQLGSLGGKCAGSVGENKFHAEAHVSSLSAVCLVAVANTNLFT